jgi:hypothetical protein
MIFRAFLSTTLPTSGDFRRVPRHQSCELTFERLGYSIAPALGD